MARRPEVGGGSEQGEGCPSNQDIADLRKEDRIKVSLARRSARTRFADAGPVNAFASLSVGVLGRSPATPRPGVPPRLREVGERGGEAGSRQELQNPGAGGRNEGLLLGVA